MQGSASDLLSRGILVIRFLGLGVLMQLSGRIDGHYRSREWVGSFRQGYLNPFSQARPSVQMSVQAHPCLIQGSLWWVGKDRGVYRFLRLCLGVGFFGSFCATLVKVVVR